MEWCLKLPYPPSINHYKKVGRIVKTKTGKLYQQRVDTNETKSFYFYTYMAAKKYMPAGWTQFSESETIKYFMKVYLYPPNNLRFDADNRLKVLCDGLVKAHVLKDDSQIHRLYVEKCSIVEGGEVIVRIQPYE